MSIRYGLPLEQILAHPPGDRCEICKREASGDPWDVLNLDHNHETGVIRGWLCGPCNRGIGLLQDSPEVLQSAIDYLTRRRE